MEEVVRLTPPINKGQIERLSAGDKILVDGFIYTARDMAHKRLVDSLPDLPFPLEGQIIYYTGPTPPRPGYPIGSCGPTTSLRVDIYTLPLLAAGLVGTIGKGSRGLAVIEAIKKYGSIYLVAIGGAGAFLSKKVLASELVAYPDLGCEAIFRLKVKDFPCYVGIDSRGNDILQVSSFEGIERERTLVIISPMVLAVGSLARLLKDSRQRVLISLKLRWSILIKSRLAISIKSIRINLFIRALSPLCPVAPALLWFLRVKGQSRECERSLVTQIQKKQPGERSGETSLPILDTILSMALIRRRQLKPRGISSSVQTRESRFKD